MTQTHHSRLEIEAQIERFVDLYGISEVAEILRNICIDKADHIEFTWQGKDSDLWSAWSDSAEILDLAAEKLYRHQEITNPRPCGLR